MLFTTHVLVGAAVGAATGNPVAAFFAGIVSHHLADWIPHFDGGSFYIGTPAAEQKNRPWNVRDWILAVADLIFGLAVFLILFRQSEFSPNMFWGGMGGIFPDIIHNVPFWREWFVNGAIGRKYKIIHRRLHNTVPLSLWYWGLATNLVLSAGSLIYLLYY